MCKFFLYLIIPIMILGLLPATGCGQSTGQSKVMIKSGKTGYLGVEVRDIDTKLKEKKDLKVDNGAYVNSVVDESPADDAGILKGDVIVAFNGKRIDDGEDLTVAVRKVKPKTEVKVDLIRNGEKMTLKAVIGKTKDLASVFAWDSKDYPLELFRSQKNLKLPKTFAFHISEKNEMDGLQVQSLTTQLGEYFGVPGGKGVMVSSVKKGSNAEQAGFKAGDVITKVNNSSVDDMSEFQEEYTEGEDEISFEVIRSGKPMNLKMKVDSDEDKDIEIEEDEDDDWSMFYRVNPPNIHLSAPTRIHLHGLKEHLSSLRYELKNKMKEIKEQIRVCLKEL